MADIQSIVQSLQARSVGIATQHGHALNGWQQAKRKHGIGAMRALCQVCGMGVIVTPKVRYGNADVAAIKGDVLFDNCIRQVKHVR